MIRMELRGAAVLDAFAGSGAAGLEALSNGASFALFVESSKAAAQVLEENIKTLKFENQSALLLGETPEILSRRPRDSYDFLFLMPPYHSGLCEITLASAPILQRTVKGSLAVCEIHREESPPNVQGWEQERDKHYGITRLVFYTRTDDHDRLGGADRC